MANNNAIKGRTVHLKTFQNANQIVEVFVRTKPKIAPSKTTLSNKPKKFIRNCELKNILEGESGEENVNIDIVNRNEVDKTKKCKSNSHAKTKEKRMVVEVSKKNRKSTKSVQSNSSFADRTWGEILKSYSSIREENTSSEDLFDDIDQFPCRESKSSDLLSNKSQNVPPSNKDRKDCGMQTSIFEGRSYNRKKSEDKLHISKFNGSEKETTIPLNLQILNKSLEKMKYTNPVLHQRKVAAATKLNTDNVQQADNISTPQQLPLALDSNGKPHVNEAERLLSDGISTTPFSDSALHLLQQLRAKLAQRGDSESSEALGFLEQYFVGAAPVHRPSPISYNSVFETPTQMEHVFHKQVHQQINRQEQQHQQAPYEEPHEYLPVENYHEQFIHPNAVSQHADDNLGQPHDGQGQQTQQKIYHQKLHCHLPPQNAAPELQGQTNNTDINSGSEAERTIARQQATIAELRSLGARLLVQYSQDHESSTTHNNNNNNNADNNNANNCVITNDANSKISSTHPRRGNPVVLPTLLETSREGDPHDECYDTRQDGAPVSYPGTSLQQPRKQSNPCRDTSTHHLNSSSLQHKNLVAQVSWPQPTPSNQQNHHLINRINHKSNHPGTGPVIQSLSANSQYLDVLMVDRNFDRQQLHHATNDPVVDAVDGDSGQCSGRSVALASSRGAVVCGGGGAAAAAAAATDRDSRAAVWSQRCDHELIRRQAACVSGAAVTVAEAHQHHQQLQPALESHQFAAPIVRPLTSTKKEHRRPPTNDSDADSAYDDKGSSSFTSKRPSPSTNEQQQQHHDAQLIVDLSPVSNLRQPNDAFVATNAVHTQLHTMRSNLPTTTSDLDSEMLRCALARQQTAINPTMQEATTVPCVVTHTAGLTNLSNGTSCFEVGGNRNGALGTPTPLNEEFSKRTAIYGRLNKKDDTCQFLQCREDISLSVNSSTRSISGTSSIPNIELPNVSEIIQGIGKLNGDGDGGCLTDLVADGFQRRPYTSRHLESTRLTNAVSFDEMRSTGNGRIEHFVPAVNVLSSVMPSYTDGGQVTGRRTLPFVTDATPEVIRQDNSEQYEILGTEETVNSYAVN